jgi:hypothetical protein|tara:strand:+ start:252 stop:641 length:390 start_codon:yes stop_codon:yes gene_type:complete
MTQDTNVPKWAQRTTQEDIEEAKTTGLAYPKLPMPGDNEKVTIRFIEEPKVIKHEAFEGGQALFAVVELEGQGPHRMGIAPTLERSLVLEMERLALNGVEGHLCVIEAHIIDTKKVKGAKVYRCRIICE